MHTHAVNCLCHKYCSMGPALYPHTRSGFLVPKHGTLHSAVPKHPLTLDLPGDLNLCHSSV